ncbi:hypothetical protein HK100_012181 [Physocladia obscura]|uniref:N-acetyltransferase domain-containing protein n=1 Tax=Physocladia obscura TaxID=109957 RepID=A0AAD5T2Q1_9FUNG|nr:hypothetical protein HK100_012181 [Physocladia obscura]
MTEKTLFTLSNFTLSDAEELTAMLQDPLIHKNTLVLPNPYTVSDAYWYINHVTELNKQFPYAERCPLQQCIRNEMGQVIGNVSILYEATGDDSNGKCGRLGYYLHKDYRGQGIVVRAVRQILSNAFSSDWPDIEWVEADIFAFNAASARVLEKAGLKLFSFRKMEVNQAQTLLIDRISTLAALLQHNQQQLSLLQDSSQSLKHQLQVARQQALEAEANGSSDAASRVAELQRETRILNQLTKQYEATIEVIMSKFRLQTDMIQKEKERMKREAEMELAEERAANEELRRENIQLQIQLQHSVHVVREALLAYEQDDISNEAATFAILHRDQ